MWRLVTLPHLKLERRAIEIREQGKMGWDVIINHRPYAVQPILLRGPGPVRNYYRVIDELSCGNEHFYALMEGP